MGMTKAVPYGGVFLRILDGSIVVKTPLSRDEEEAWMRGEQIARPGLELYKTINPSTTPPTPVAYWIDRFGEIYGYLAKVERVERPDNNVYGWKLHLLDDVEMLLDLKDGAPTTRRVLAMLPNVDLTQHLKIKVFKDKEGYNAIMFEQMGVNVPQYWTKERLPEPVVFGGKKNYFEAEKMVHEATINLIQQINMHGEPALQAYQSRVKNAVETGQYTPHPAETDHAGEFSGPPQAYVPPVTEALPPGVSRGMPPRAAAPPKSANVATDEASMASDKQLQMLRSLGKERALDVDVICMRQMGCTLVELNKRAASDLIEYVSQIAVPMPSAEQFPPPTHAIPQEPPGMYPPETDYPPTVAVQPTAPAPVAAVATAAAPAEPSKPKAPAKIAPQQIKAIEHYAGKLNQPMDTDKGIVNEYTHGRTQDIKQMHKQEAEVAIEALSAMAG